MSHLGERRFSAQAPQSTVYTKILTGPINLLIYACLSALCINLIFDRFLILPLPNYCELILLTLICLTMSSLFASLLRWPSLRIVRKSFSLQVKDDIFIAEANMKVMSDITDPQEIAFPLSINITETPDLPNKLILELGERKI